MRGCYVRRGTGRCWLVMYNDIKCALWLMLLHCFQNAHISVVSTFRVPFEYNFKVEVIYTYNKVARWCLNENLMGLTAGLRCLALITTRGLLTQSEATPSDGFIFSRVDSPDIYMTDFRYKHDPLCSPLRIMYLRDRLCTPASLLHSMTAH